MSKLIIANSRTQEMVGDLALLTPEERVSGGWGAQRLFWFAEDGDILVLPWVAEDAYVDYVLGLTGTDRSTLTLLVPPSGSLGPELLTPDRLADERFRAELKEALAGRDVQRIFTAYDDAFVVDLAKAMGIESALPGFAFSEQGGVGLVNSKATFRAVAAGSGVAIAPGAITASAEQAESVITGILGRGRNVIVKKEFAGGGFGNEILATEEGVRPAGARNVVLLPDAEAIKAYVAERWSWLTGGRDDRLVIEEYFTNAVTVYAEFVITDEGCDLLGTGEILMEPVAIGEIVPPRSLAPEAHKELVEAGRQVCEPFRIMGYRGNISADAILTQDGAIIFSETNGRLTGSTHLHAVLRDRMLAPSHRGERVLVERATWSVPSFTGAVRMLNDAGLGFDPETGTGVVLTGNYVPVNGKVMYCVVAEDLAAADAMVEAMLALTADEK
ncbi:preATP grasp domain-containing protein [Streptomyces odontomachi]|uniref:preATP grasp domain-containing protein n=1 Tax=Streptomyces odontomachi TaxID=2944940 RepID=UPI002108DC6D|nr:peptide ligase PGM1-related protein [Streptomyces sp. ODS25]